MGTVDVVVWFTAASAARCLVLLTPQYSLSNPEVTLKRRQSETQNKTQNTYYVIFLKSTRKFQILETASKKGMLKRIDETVILTVGYLYV